MLTMVFKVYISCGLIERRHAISGQSTEHLDDNQLSAAALPPPWPSFFVPLLSRKWWPLLDCTPPFGGLDASCR